MTRILVVEDEPGIALGLEEDLRLEGYGVEIAGDGEAALDRAVGPKGKIQFVRDQTRCTLGGVLRFDAPGLSQIGGRGLGWSGQAAGIAGTGKKPGRYFGDGDPPAGSEGEEENNKEKIFHGGFS